MTYRRHEQAKQPQGHSPYCSGLKCKSKFQVSMHMSRVLFKRLQARPSTGCCWGKTAVRCIRTWFRTCIAALSSLMTSAKQQALCRRSKPDRAYVLPAEPRRNHGVNIADVDMSFQTGEAAASSDMQEGVSVSETGSAHPPLPKMLSWGASGHQGLFKQPSAGLCNPFVERNAQRVLACSHNLRSASCHLHSTLVH